MNRRRFLAAIAAAVAPKLVKYESADVIDWNSANVPYELHRDLSFQLPHPRALEGRWVYITFESDGQRLHIQVLEA